MRSEFERLHKIEGEYGGHEVHIEPGASRMSNLFNTSGPMPRVQAYAGRGGISSRSRRPTGVTFEGRPQVSRDKPATRDR
jgi:hypothetical protein